MIIIMPIIISQFMSLSKMFKLIAYKFCKSKKNVLGYLIILPLRFSSHFSRWTWFRQFYWS